MLESIAILLVIMWAVGLGTGYALGGLIHVLLLLAIITVVVRLFQGHGHNRPLT